jgi:hypothetical protein
MLLAMVMVMGCAVSEDGDAELHATTHADRVIGTLSQDELTIRFELSPGKVLVTTIEGDVVFEATPAGTRISGTHSELELVDVLKAKLDGTIECRGPQMPKWWFVEADAKSLAIP